VLSTPTSGVVAGSPLGSTGVVRVSNAIAPVPGGASSGRYERHGTGCAWASTNGLNPTPWRSSIHDIAVDPDLEILAFARVEPAQEDLLGVAHGDGLTGGGGRCGGGDSGLCVQRSGRHATTAASTA
jgi:hypothetical protein